MMHWHGLGALKRAAPRAGAKKASASLTRIAVVSSPNPLSTDSEELAEKVLESLSQALLVLDRQGRVCWNNTAAARFWPLRPPHLCGCTISQLFGDALLLQLQRCLGEECSVTLHSYAFAPAPGEPPLQLRLQMDPLSAGAAGCLGVVLTLWDHGQLEQQSQAHRTLDAITLLVRRLAHELHNPLSGIKGATQLLARRMEDLPRSTAGLTTHVQVILTELERMERLLKTLLLQGGEQPLLRERFNLHELLDTVIWFESHSQQTAVGRDSAGVRFVRDYDPSLPELDADKDKLHQVFLNLIRNALEASPPRGTITVRTRSSGAWTARQPPLDPAGTYYRIDVADEGEGVSEAQREKLFTPFFSSKPLGGLGLSISYQIVRAHGGLLDFSPGVPSGAVFSVILPLGMATKSAPPAPT